MSIIFIMQVLNDIIKETFFFINNGEYTKVLSYLEDLLVKFENKQDIYLFVLNQIGRLQIYFSNYQEAMKISEKLNLKGTKFENKPYQLASFQKKCDIFFHQGKYFEILEERKQMINNINSCINYIEIYGDIEEKRILAEYYLSIGKNYQYAENEVETKKKYANALNLYKEIKDDLGYAEVLSKYANREGLKGNFQKSIILFKESIAISTNYKPNIITAWTFSYYSWLNYQLGNIDEMEKYVYMTLNIAKNISNIHLIDWCFTILSYVFHQKDDIEKAYNYEMKSLELRKNRGNIIEICHSLNHLAFMDILRQNNEEAQKKFELILTYSKVIKIPKFKAFFLTSAAKFYDRINKKLNSYFYLEKARDILRNSNDINAIIENLYSLFRLCLNDKNDNYCQKIYLDLKNLLQIYPNNEKISMLLDLMKALMLSFKTRLKDRLGAEDLLIDFFKKYQIKNSIYFDAMIYYCQLLFFELNLLHNQSLVSEIINISDQILKYSSKQELWTFYTKALLIKAKVALHNKDIKKSKMILSQSRVLLSKAENIAVEKGMLLLAKEISLQHDDLLGLIEKIEKNQDKNTNINRYIPINSDHYVNLIPLKSQNQKSKNIPQSLIIWTKKGLDIYNFSFSNEKKSTTALYLANFLSTYDEFSKMIFASEKSIDRIRHGEYTIIIRNLEIFFIGYIFKGNSFIAVKNVKKFVNFLNDNKHIFEKLKNSHDIGITLDKNTSNILDGKIKSIFR